VKEETKDDKITYTFKNAKVLEFNNHNYYDRTLDYVSTAIGHVIKDKTYSTKKIEKFQQLANKEIQVEGKKVEEVSDENKKSKVYEFTPTDENADYLVEKLGVFITGQLKDVNKEIQKLMKDEDANKFSIEILKSRKQSLNSLRTIVQKKNMESNDKIKNVNFATAFDIVFNDINTIAETSSKQLSEYRKVERHEDRRGLGEEIRKAYHKAVSMNVLITAIKEIANEAELDSDHAIMKNSQEYTQTWIR